MTHDPLCPMGQPCEEGTHHLLGNPVSMPAYCDPCGAECQCDLIAKIRDGAQPSPLDRVLAAVSVGNATTHRPPTHRQRLTDDKLTIDDPITHDSLSPLAPEEGGLHGDIPDTPEVRAWFERLANKAANGSAMTHDPRCPLEGNDCFDRTEHALMEESPDWCGDCGETCQCALIAQVRAEADARLHRIRAEIAALMCPDTDEGHCEACEQYREALACIDRAFTASGKSA